MKTLFYTVLLACLASCSLLEKTEFKQEPLATVHGKELHGNDLVGVVPENTSYDDSLLIVKEYVNNWVRKQLVLSLAEANVAESELAVLERRAQEYKEDLMIFSYEQRLVNAKVDTVINANALKEYHQEVKSNFILKDLWLSASCIRVSKDAPKLDSIKTWMRSPVGRYEERLNQYGMEYGQFFSNDTTVWFDYSSLKKYTPGLKIYSPKVVLKFRSYYESEDSLTKSFMRIHDYHLEGEEAPLELVEDKIKNMLLIKRKKEYIESLHEDLYKKAFSKDQFTIAKEYE